MILEVKNLRVGYDGLEVLKGISIFLKQKEIAALIGPNGSGKSTLFKAICGLLRPVSGMIGLLGKNIEQADAETILGGGLSYVPQGQKVFQSLTVEENLDLGGYLLRSVKKVKEKKKEIYERFPILEDKSNSLGGELSGGQQQILGIARAMMLSPKLLLLDEPSHGVDPKTLEVIFDKVKQLKAEGVAIFIVEQNVRAALEIADYVYYLRMGEIAAKGPPLEIEKELNQQGFWLR
jgi:branched-chain amino acid transport system ATP-binding protein